MKITHIEAIHLRLPEVVEAADGTQDCLIVRVHTDADITGLGEVVSCSYVAKAVIEAPRSAPFRHGLAAIITGMDALDFDTIHNAMIEGVSWYGPGGVARQAIEWHRHGTVGYLGKSRRQSRAQAIARRCGRCSACLCERTVARVSRVGPRIRERILAQGYQSVKYGWAPMGPDPDLDEALVAAARDALGPDVNLMVDAGRAWNAEPRWSACAI